ncbi:MAG: penicillin-binding protein, partial [Solobacterium sp.]|nr:penicillin-binding protein [Solobacterium sp.]
MASDNRKRAVLSAEDKKLRNRKRYLRRLRLRRILTVILVIGVVIELCVGLFAVRFLQKNLAGKPVLDPKDFISEESSKIYDSEGTLLTEIGTYYREN